MNFKFKSLLLKRPLSWQGHAVSSEKQQKIVRTLFGLDFSGGKIKREAFQ